MIFAFVIWILVGSSNSRIRKLEHSDIVALIIMLLVFTLFGFLEHRFLWEQLLNK